MLYEMGLAERTVMWNTFAFHPHRAADPYSNRRAMTWEIDTSSPLLEAVVAHRPEEALSRWLSRLICAGVDLCPLPESGPLLGSCGVLLSGMNPDPLPPTTLR